MKVALVQDWLTELGGAEKVFSAIYELFPQADIYTLVYHEEVLDKLNIPKQKVSASFIQKLPFAKTKYRNYLPLFTRAIESFDLSGYDLIISSSYCVAKGVLTHANQIHICYCHSPVRYAWDLYFRYMNDAGLNNDKPKSIFVRKVLHKLRIWDVVSSNRVDFFIANSDYIAKRIYKVYRREAAVIYPPVAVNDFDYTITKEDFYFTCSRMVPYKKIDLIAKAFSKMPGKRLVIIGAGPDMNKVMKYKTDNIEILGYQSFSVLKNYMQRAKAFVFAAEEDFGIVPLEAQASGTPVIAYGKGGALETVIDGNTGIYFYEQTDEAIINAVEKFEKLHRIDPYTVRVHAEYFSERRFKEQIKCFIEEKLSK